MTSRRTPIQTLPKPTGAIWVAAGIFLSRIAGLVRERALAHYLGNSPASDAFKAALRIPNFLQNLFGEGVLSAAFIPVYAGLLNYDPKEAQRLARCIATLLSLLVCLLGLGGVFATPFLVDVLAPGFSEDRRVLTIGLVRIMFPGVGLLVLSALCLGVLNSHRRFFLSYVAPVFWNAAIVGALLLAMPQASLDQIAIYAAWGLVGGSFLQLGIQLPLTIKLVGSILPVLDLKSTSVQTVLKNFTPAVIGRGVVQLSAYVDTMIASLLPVGTLSALAYAQTLYLLPVSLFGMSVSAAELPAMSADTAIAEDFSARLKARLRNGLERIRFFIIPSAMAFVFVGDHVAALVFQSGSFGASDSLWVWKALAALGLGLVASTQSRLFSSAFYAQNDPRTPLKIAIIRVATSSALGLVLVLGVARKFNVPGQWTTAFLGFSSSLASWLEFYLLKRALERQIGRLEEPFIESLKVWGASAAGVFCSFVGSYILRTVTGGADIPPLVSSGLVLLSYVFGFGVLCWVMKVEALIQIIRHHGRR